MLDGLYLLQPSVSSQQPDYLTLVLQFSDEWYQGLTQENPLSQHKHATILPELVEAFVLPVTADVTSIGSLYSKLFTVDAKGPAQMNA